MKFFHTADTHLGVENYGRIDPKTGIHSRLWDFASNLERIVDQAIEAQADFFLFCGDAYKTAHPTPTQQKLFMLPLLRLYNAQIPVVIIVGNHDHPLSFGKAHSLDVFSSLPLNGFFVFSKPCIQIIPTKNGPVQIVGIPWPLRNNLVTLDAHRFKSNQDLTSNISEKVGSIIQSLAQELDPCMPAILAGHLSVSTALYSGSEKTAIYGLDPLFLPSQLAIQPFNYVALGHIHRHQDVNAKGTIPIVYPGSIERVDFGERKEKKGYCSVSIQKDSAGGFVCSYDFVELPSRSMHVIDIHVQSNGDQTQQIIDVLNTYDLDGAIVKIAYHLPAGTSDHVDINKVQQACGKVHYLASLAPVHIQETTQRRATLKVDMDFSCMLSRYFQTKDFATEKQEELIKKTLQLECEVSCEKDNPQP